MSDTGNALLDWFDAFPRSADVRYDVRKNAAIREWCLQRIGIREGDRVRVRRLLVDDPKSGWWCYRETLAIGQTGVVVGVDFNTYTNDWQANVKFDREWSVHRHVSGVERYWNGKVDDTPEGYVPPSAYNQREHPEGKRHTFSIGVGSLEVIRDA